MSAEASRLHQRFPRLAARIERVALGPGYGHGTPESERALALAREREGLELEPVYTAKAIAGLLAMQEEERLGGGPVLYRHTHNAHHADRSPRSG
jgi:1-aminocyclopropane-1-carboxylate deaminase/D-cysteine desulfhydrase-like pyridoxal-dependent ACC family enzyme